MKSRLNAANNSSEIIDYSAPVARVSKLLDQTEALKEDVEDKIQWLTDVMEKNAEFSAAVTAMEEWLPEVEKNLQDLGPMSTDLEIIKKQIKDVQVRQVLFMICFRRVGCNQKTNVSFRLIGK